jgi:hypothetical protein
MSGTELAIFGITGALLNIIGNVPYVLDILRHKTRPQRSMWWIYAGLFVLLFAAQVGAGAKWVLVITAEYVLSSLLIAVLSLRYGFGTFHKRDLYSIAVAIAGLLAWLLTNNPLLAICMVIIIDFAGFWLTLVKTWHAPHSETLISWELSFVGALLSIFSVGTWSIAVIIYPVYAVLGTGLLVWLIIYRRRQVTQDPADF